MPVLPSGRRVEFSLDRFHALLGRMDPERASLIADALHEPDDLLLVMDAVHFSLESGKPYFADYVAADWESYASDWNMADRDALRSWFRSDSARLVRGEAISDIKTLASGLAFAPINPFHAWMTASAPIAAGT